MNIGLTAADCADIAAIQKDGVGEILDFTTTHQPKRTIWERIKEMI